VLFADKNMVALLYMFIVVNKVLCYFEKHSCWSKNSLEVGRKRNSPL